MDSEDIQNEDELEDEENVADEVELVDPNTLSNGGKTVIVGGWSFIKTIAAALEKCEPGDTIHCHSGEYDEDIILASNGISIQGPVDLSCVLKRGVTSTAIGCSLKHLSINGGVNVRAGNLVLSECDITAPQSHGVQVFRLAHPIVHGCSIHDISKSHIYIYPEGRGSFEGNELVGDGRRGSVGLFMDHAVGTCFANNQISHVMTGAYCRGPCLNCQINQNTFANLSGHGIYLDQLSHPSLKGNQISNAQHYGVLVGGGAKGVLSNNIVFGSVRIHKGCHPSLFHNLVVKPGQIITDDDVFALRGIEVKTADQIPKPRPAPAIDAANS